MNYVGYSPTKDLSEEALITANLQNILESLSDDNYENIFLKARIDSYLGNDEEADYYFDEVSKISPNWPLNYLEWGRHYLKNGNFEMAEKYFQLVDVNLPDLSNELINEEHKQSVRSYKYVMYSEIGNAYLESGNYKRANNFLQAAYKAKPENYAILKKIADTYYLQGDLDSAIKYNSHGEQLNPSDYNWPLALAVLYYEANNVDKALFYLNKAYELAPDIKKIEIDNLRSSYQK